MANLLLRLQQKLVNRIMLPILANKLAYFMQHADEYRDDDVLYNMYIDKVFVIKEIATELGIVIEVYDKANAIYDFQGRFKE